MLPALLSFSISSTNYRQGLANNSVVNGKHPQMGTAASCRSCASKQYRHVLMVSLDAGVLACRLDTESDWF